MKDLPISREVFACLTHGHLLDGVTVEVSDLCQTVVLVQALGECFTIWGCTVEDVGVSYDTITGLECNTWLEGIRIYCTDHLERNVWAVEETGVIW
jgi:hypothetical protein